MKSVSARQVWAVLNDVVGTAKAVQILDQLAGHQCYFPAVEVLIRQERDRDIVREHMDGVPTGTIAASNNLTAAKVMKIIMSHQQRDVKMQKDARAKYEAQNDLTSEFRCDGEVDE